MSVIVKRVYDAASPDDGLRVLVDRLWPRGVTKERAAIDVWAKEVTPSSELRQAWHAAPDAHSPERFAAFAAAYTAELASGAAAQALDELVNLARTHDRITLVYGAKHETENHAVVLLAALRNRMVAP